LYGSVGRIGVIPIVASIATKTTTGDGDGDGAYIHDANNNVISQTIKGASTTFNYDRNRLVSTTTGGASAAYNYDPYGRPDIVTSAGAIIERNKIQVQQAAMAAYQRDIAELQRMPRSPRRDDKIAKLQAKIAAAQALVAEYTAINENNRDEVFGTLNKTPWRKSLPYMVNKEMTRFTDNKMMESIVAAAVAANQAAIDAAFTAPDGNAKPNGTEKVITHPAPPGLGVGYELDPSNLVVPITRPPTKVVLRLLVSDSVQRHFMVETAYFE
jgi:YD repeat-containing protein